MINFKDQLEEEDNIVRCKHCLSLNIQEEVLEGTFVEWCASCGTTDYTEVIDIKQHLKQVNG